MIAQVFEPFSGGHHTTYVSFLLPALIRLLDSGHLERVVLTTTDHHAASPAFVELLARYEGRVAFDVVPAGDIYGSGHTVSTVLLDSLKRNRPDFVVSTSADNGALTLALRCLVDAEFRSRSITSVGVFHYGSYDSARGIRELPRSAVQRFSRRFSPWTELHVVNPLLYDRLRSAPTPTSRRVKFLPHPVAATEPLAKADARRRLQLSVEGSYIGQIGQSNGTKAIPELLRAFREARPRPDQRLLVAGKIYGPFRELIDREYQDMVDRGQLILIDRYLTLEEMHVATSAVDVISISDYTGKLSSTLLAAVGSERPVIADRGGYTGLILDHFEVGYRADMRDRASFAAAISAALATGRDFVFSEKVDRLVQFHDPRHFVDTLLGPLYARLDIRKPASMQWHRLLQGPAASVTASSVADRVTSGGVRV
jgi:glycosyltransferase involved in cell wall biosynthesis